MSDRTDTILDLKEISNALIDINIPSLDFMDPHINAYLKDFDLVHLDNTISNILYIILSLTTPASSNEARYAENIISSNTLKQDEINIISKALSDIDDTALPFIYKLYILSLIEGDDPDSHWVNHCKEKITESNANHTRWLYELYSLSFPSNIIRGRNQGITIFKNHKSLKVINDLANRTSNKIFTKKINTNIDINKKISHVTFVCSKPFSDQANTHCNFFINFSKYFNLAESDIELSFMVTGESSFRTPWGALYGINKKSIDKTIKIWGPQVGKESNVFIKNINSINGFDKAKVLESAHEWLNNKKPDVIVFIGGVYESHLFRKHCFGKFPIVLLPTTTNVNNHLGMPDNYIDAIWARNAIHERKLIQRGVEVEKISNFMAPFNTSLMCEDYDWSEFTQKPSGFILASVLSEGRMSKYISQLNKSDVNLFIELFYSNQNLTMILVGENKNSIDNIIKTSIEFKKLIDGGRILYTNRIDNLMGFYQQIDGVFSLPISGGSGGISAAIYQDLPAIVYSDSDAAGIAPKDGQYDSFKEAMTLLNKLINHTEFRTSLQNENKKILQSRSHKNTFKEFIGMLQKARVNASKRVN